MMGSEDGFNGCVFFYEGGVEHPCWGDIEFWEDTPDGGAIMCCEAHYDYSLCVSFEENIKRYKAKP